MVSLEGLSQSLGHLLAIRIVIKVGGAHQPTVEGIAPSVVWAQDRATARARLIHQLCSTVRADIVKGAESATIVCHNNGRAGNVAGHDVSRVAHVRLLRNGNPRRVPHAGFLQAVEAGVVVDGAWERAGLVNVQSGLREDGGRIHPIIWHRRHGTNRCAPHEGALRRGTPHAQRQHLYPRRKAGHRRPDGESALQAIRRRGP